MRCRAEYLNGSLVADPAATAGNQGTIISVTDLFYNVPTRIKSLSNPSEEYAHIVRVMQRYAIELAGRVGFACKKAGIAGTCDVQTSAGPTTTSKDVIRSVFGGQIAKGLVAINPITEPSINVQVRGCVSTPTFHQKALTFILFINGRLVESNHIKRTITTLYHQILPKGTSPFIYLSLQMPPQNVDVNVHPTKSEVFFLHEPEILEFVEQTVRQTIEATAMVLQTQGGAAGSQERMTAWLRPADPTANGPASTAPPVTQAPRAYPFQLVHSDPRTRTLDTYILPSLTKPRTGEASPSSTPGRSGGDSPTPTGRHSGGGSPSPTAGRRERPPKLRRTLQLSRGAPREARPGAADPLAAEDPRELTSVQNLTDELVGRSHARLTELVKNSVIVGVFDTTRTLIQYQSRLLLIEHLRFAAEMLYQKCLLGFGYLDCWKLQAPVLLGSLVDAATAAAVQEQGELLLAYFSIQIVNGSLVALPRLLEGLQDPPAGLLAAFLGQLAGDVEWDDEQDCFEGVAKLLANLYTALVARQPRADEYVRHFLYPALKGNDLSRFGRILGYDGSLVGSGAIVELTSTHELYKIFERC